MTPGEKALKDFEMKPYQDQAVTLGLLYFVWSLLIQTGGFTKESVGDQ